MNDYFLLIPAYNPDKNFIKLFIQIKELLPDITIIIVNDGSNSDIVFKDIKRNFNQNDRIITHPTNLGKGEALKSGFKYIIDNYPLSKGIITADCDLQHSAEDIIKITNAISNNSNKIYMGKRNFKTNNIPLKSIIGNKFMTCFLNIFYNIKLEDTQTGLRAIPTGFIKEILKIKTNDFSFETLMLLKAKKNNIQIEEIPINTIYINKNKNSNFRPMIDSYKIIKSILKETI